MNLRQRQAINGFFAAIKELRESGVIRSHRYLGDIAEFLCAKTFGIDLATDLRRRGHDGTRQQLRAQIKFGGGTKKNIDFGNPAAYDEVYVVLGKESALRSYPHEADFLIYRFASDDVRAIGQTNMGKYSCGVDQFRHTPDEVIFISELGNALNPDRVHNQN